MQIFLNEITSRYRDERIVMVVEWRGVARKFRLGCAGKYAASAVTSLLTGIEPGRKHLGRTSREEFQ